MRFFEVDFFDNDKAKALICQTAPYQISLL